STSASGPGCFVSRPRSSRRSRDWPRSAERSTREIRVRSPRLDAVGSEGALMTFENVKKVWMNGTLVDFADAKISVFTHALHYGSGVFEGERCYKTTRGPEIFRPDDHLDRLLWSAKIYRMEIPYTIDQLRDATLETVRANGFAACYIRPLVYRGFGSLGVN